MCMCGFIYKQCQTKANLSATRLSYQTNTVERLRSFIQSLCASEKDSHYSLTTIFFWNNEPFKK